MRNRFSLTLCSVALALGACSGEAPRAAEDSGRAFLDSIQGQWVGVLTETGALQYEVIREMPMRLTVGPTEATVEYPMLRCRGVLQRPPEGIQPDTESVARFQLAVDPPGISPCMPGLVRLTRDVGVLKYVFLGDSLRRIEARLARLP